MQHVVITFKPGAPKRFTYHNDTGVEAEVGDKVDVETENGSVSVHVVEVWPGRPPTLRDNIKTKPILRVRQAAAPARQGG